MTDVWLEELRAELANVKTLPKAQRTRGLSSFFQSNLFGHITSSNTNLPLQNLEQAFTSKSQPNITISTKLKIQNID